MSILKIKDLVHKYVTYGDTEEDKQEIAAIDHQWTFDADRRHSIYQRNGYKR